MNKDKAKKTTTTTTRVLYMRGDKRQTQGGSTANCQEIKASEGTSAVSSNYWLDSIEADLAVLVPCDMRTGSVFL